MLAADGTVLAINAAFATLYGIVASELIGRPHSAFTADIEVRRLGDYVGEEGWVTSRALRGDRVSGVRQAIRNAKTGREFVARCGASPYFEDGKLIATTITVEDITEHVRAQQSIEGALSAAEAGAYRIDLVANKVWGDANFARLHCLTPEGAQGGPLARMYELVHPDDLDRVTTVIRAATMTGEAHEVEYRVLMPEGRFRWLLSRGRAELDPNGQPFQRLGSIVDITERRMAEEMLRDTTDAVPVLVSYMDADFTYRFCNRAYEAFYGRPRELVIGRFVGDMTGPKAFASAKPYFDRALTGENVSFSTWMDYAHVGRRFMHVEYRPRVGLNGKVEGVYALVVDGTRQRFAEEALERSEQALREANEDLERRVEERMEDLKRSNRDLNEFAYSVAHDLRAPLRAIVSTSRILLEDAGDRLQPVERATLERQATNAVRLAGIVDDLLGFARLAQAELRREPFDFTAMAKQVTAEVAGRDWKQAPEVVIQDGIVADGDRSLLSYVLTNLLDNAFKFSPHGGTVTVGEREGAFFVRDEGVGFDPQHARKLFVAFERLVDQETFPGTGVGLANVKRIIERHRGRVWAESELGHGATFWFTLAPSE